jgi:hypothetical protein
MSFWDKYPDKKPLLPDMPMAKGTTHTYTDLLINDLQKN